MKKQVLSTPVVTNVINSSETNETNFYGVISQRDIKTFITCTSDGTFYCPISSKLTRGVSSVTGTRNIITTINYIISLDCTVYQFDTARELFTWLSNND